MERKNILQNYEFYSKADAEDFKAFIDKLIGIKTELKVSYCLSGDIKVVRAWEVILGKVKLSPQQDTDAKKLLADLSSKRNNFIEEKNAEYQVLEIDELDDRWSARESLDEDERNVLRCAFRQKNGINQRVSTSPSVCSGCGMVEDNCTCGRTFI